MPRTACIGKTQILSLLNPFERGTLAQASRWESVYYKQLNSNFLNLIGDIEELSRVFTILDETS